MSQPHTLNSSLTKPSPAFNTVIPLSIKTREIHKNPIRTPENSVLKGIHVGQMSRGRRPRQALCSLFPRLGREKPDFAIRGAHPRESAPAAAERDLRHFETKRGGGEGKRRRGPPGTAGWGRRPGARAAAPPGGRPQPGPETRWPGVKGPSRGRPGGGGPRAEEGKGTTAES